MHRRVKSQVSLLAAISVAIACTPSEAKTAESPFGVQEQKIDDSVNQALKWLVKQQLRNGSFGPDQNAEPAITSLCLLALLAMGHTQTDEQYGAAIDKGTAFVLSCQKRSGLIVHLLPGPAHKDSRPSHTAIYTHAISGLLLCELYGMVEVTRTAEMRQVIRQALDYTRTTQLDSKVSPADIGGWRYIYPTSPSSDLSVTCWQLLFLRSAKSAGFEVPSQWIEEAKEYVARCFSESTGAFRYASHGATHEVPYRAMTGAGILSLSLAGTHNTSMARSAGNWLLEQPFRVYKEELGSFHNFHYSAFYCSQAMFQLGKPYWSRFYPILVETLLRHQHSDGRWTVDASGDKRFGDTFRTALAVLALSPPYQVLPIFQR